MEETNVLWGKKGLNIYKRKDGRWEGRFPKGKKEDGRIYYGYIYDTSFKKVRERVIEERFNYQLTAIPQVIYKGNTSQWLSFWLCCHVKNKVKVSTYTNYAHKVTTYILPYLGDKKLCQLKPEDITKWLEILEERLSPSSIHTVFRLIRSALEEAVRRQYLVSNPCETCVLPKSSKSQEIKALTHRQQARVTDYARTNKKGLPFLLALETGMRVGEICGLKWQDVNFEEGYLTVKCTRQRILKEGGQGSMIVETPPKTLSSFRIIPLSEGLKKKLKECCERKTRTQYVIEEGAKPVEPRTLSYRFHQLMKKWQWESLTFHSLRHTFATRCVESGANIAAVSALLGHSSIKTTLDIYTTTFFSEKRKQSISCLFFKKYIRQ